MPAQVRAEGMGGEVLEGWRRQTAPDWFVSEFHDPRSPSLTLAGFCYPGILILPVGAPVTVEIIGPGGVVETAFDWAGPLDVNTDGFVDILDFNLWTNWFEAGDMRADFNADGFLDPLDQADYVNRFEGRTP